MSKIEQLLDRLRTVTLGPGVVESSLHLAAARILAQNPNDTERLKAEANEFLVRTADSHADAVREESAYDQILTFREHPPAPDELIHSPLVLAGSEKDAERALGGQLKTGNFWTAQNRQLPAPDQDR